MLFSSLTFLSIFLPIVFIFGRCLKGQAANIFLLVASLFFYAWGEPIYVLLMIFSICSNYLLGLWIEKSRNCRTLVFIFTVILNLGLLGFFKYANMFVDIFNRIFKTGFAGVSLMLPIGISFYTFQILSYIIDLYRGKFKAQRNIINLALYISFFPQLIAGPIVRYEDINSQVEHRIVDSEKTAAGIRRFIYGLGKKVILANILAECADGIYAIGINEVSPALAWVAAICYMLDIYYDFSGYSDMAIGLGSMFGFDFLENFNYPYLSQSIGEFWRRWHISLGTWFREYLYIPLGGNRKGSLRTYFNLGIVFFMTGLWHGSTYNFIVWGLYHGFFSVIERLGLNKLLNKNKIIARIYTLLVVMFGWVIFAVSSLKEGAVYIKRMIMPWIVINTHYSVGEFFTHKTALALIAAILGAGIIKSFSENTGLFKNWKNSLCEKLWCAAVLAISIIQLVSNTYNPFIYFRF